MFKILRRIDQNGSEFEAVRGDYPTAASVVTRLTDYALKLADYGRTMYVVTPEGEKIVAGDFVYQNWTGG